MALDYLKENCLATTGSYAGKSFVYLGCPGYTTGVPDLDNMISHAYAYGYKISGYTREDYLSLATTIFNTAVSDGYAGSSKHFNQQFRTSGHTVAYLTLDGGNISPVAVASASPTTGEAPLEVNFSGSASDPDGTIVSYEWNFGDGNTSDQQSPTHTYSTAGDYTATLTVTDNDGATGSDSLTITVTSETETVYSDIPIFGNTDNWSPLTPGYWEVAIDPTSGDRAYFLNDTARSDPEYTLFDAETYENFTLTLRARTAEPSTNVWRDYLIIFGFQDPENYYYAFFNASVDYDSNAIMKREGGSVVKISDPDEPPTIVDSSYHDIEITRVGDTITVKMDGVTTFTAADSTFGAGRIGLGSYNDSAYFDDVNVTPIEALGQPGKPIHIDS
jgi:PKD repeat protein